MPEKKTKADKRYRIDGKTFTWTTEEGAEVHIPMRIKVKVIRTMGERDLDATTMFEIIEAIAPNQADVIDEMDMVTDFQPMFEAWNAEYNALSGATLGE